MTSNTIEDLIVYGKSKVHADLAKMLLADLLNINSLELLMRLKEDVSPEIVELFKYRVNELNKGRPIQYIIGNVNFYGLTLKVDENVLIPRFETEQLVEQTIIKIKEVFGNKKISIIDLGTGSGAIGLTLKSKIPTADVTLLDISSGALDVAKYNAETLGLEVNFIHNDMLEGINNKYDVIISNPPYIKTNEEIEDIVYNNEPHLALYGGEEGLDYYEQILKSAKNNLYDRFLIAFEIGDTQKEPIFDLIKKYLPGTSFECIKDLSNRDRIILIYN